MMGLFSSTYLPGGSHLVGKMKTNGYMGPWRTVGPMGPRQLQYMLFIVPLIVILSRKMLFPPSILRLPSFFSGPVI